MFTVAKIGIILVTIKNLSPMYTYLYFAYKYAHIG